MNFTYVFRRHRRALLAAFLLGAAAYALYLLCGPREYLATATILVKSFQAPSPDPGAAVKVPKNNLGDVVAASLVMSSANITERVIASMPEADRQNFLKPYSHWWRWGSPKTLGQALNANRRAAPVPDSMMFAVSFTHPDPAMAAQVANLLASEFVKFSDENKTRQTEKYHADQVQKARDAHQRSDDIEAKMNALVEKYGTANLDPSAASVYSTAIQDLNKTVAADKTALDQSTTFVKEIESQQLAGKPLWELSFMAKQPAIDARLRTYNDAISQLQAILGQQYAEDSPLAVIAKGKILAAGADLAQAADSAAHLYRSDVEGAQGSYDLAVKRLADKQQEASDLEKNRTAYDGLHHDLETAESVYKSQMLVAQQDETIFDFSLPDFSVMQNAEIPGSPDRPPFSRLLLTAVEFGGGGCLLTLLVLAWFRPVPSAEREEHERRRRRHRHFHSGRDKGGSSSSRRSR